MKNISFILIAALFLFVTPLIAHALPDEEGGGPGERYFFTLAGEIHGISSGSPVSAYISNGDAFSVAGYFYSDGRLDLTQLKIMPDDQAGGPGSIIAEPNPEGGGGGGIIAMPDAGGGGGGEKFSILLQPSLRFSYLNLNDVNMSPYIKFIFDDPGGFLTLDNLEDHLTQLASVEFSSLALDIGPAFYELHPTVTTFQLESAPVPEPSTLLLLASGLAGAGFMRKRFRRDR